MILTLTIQTLPEWQGDDVHLYGGFHFGSSVELYSCFRNPFPEVILHNTEPGGGIWGVSFLNKSMDILVHIVVPALCLKEQGAGLSLT